MRANEYYPPRPVIYADGDLADALMEWAHQHFAARRASLAVLQTERQTLVSVLGPDIDDTGPAAFHVPQTGQWITVAEGYSEHTPKLVYGSRDYIERHHPDLAPHVVRPMTPPRWGQLEVMDSDAWAPVRDQYADTMVPIGPVVTTALPTMLTLREQAYEYLVDSRPSRVALRDDVDSAVSDLCLFDLSVGFQIILPDLGARVRMRKTPPVRWVEPDLLRDQDPDLYAHLLADTPRAEHVPYRFDVSDTAPDGDVEVRTFPTTPPAWLCE